VLVNARTRLFVGEASLPCFRYRTLDERPGPRQPLRVTADSFNTPRADTASLSLDERGARMFTPQPRSPAPHGDDRR
jgi:hypothetical protein